MSNQNEPAFPTPHDADEEANLILCGGKPGLTKLEYFAGLAMQGDWAAQDETLGFFSNDATNETLSLRAALYARAAKAMIAELEKAQ